MVFIQQNQCVGQGWSQLLTTSSAKSFNVFFYFCHVFTWKKETSQKLFVNFCFYINLFLYLWYSISPVYQVVIRSEKVIF